MAYDPNALTAEDELEWKFISEIHEMKKTEEGRARLREIAEEFDRKFRPVPALVVGGGK